MTGTILITVFIGMLLGVVGGFTIAALLGKSGAESAEETRLNGELDTMMLDALEELHGQLLYNNERQGWGFMDNKGKFVAAGKSARQAIAAARAVHQAQSSK